MAEQPGWPIPVAMPSSGLVQAFRVDFARLITPSATETWNYGLSRGFYLVPWYRTEVDVLIPAYIQHNSAVRDGFGDFSMLLKYRLASGNESHGAYSLSVALGTTLPTASYKNGSPYCTVSPTLLGGKGFGRFDVQSSLGAVLPTANGAQVGRVLLWNTVGQFHGGKWFWLEVEDNASFYHDGPNDGRAQNFVTPGFLLGKFNLRTERSSRLAVLFGGGVQIATSHFHTYNHALVFTGRMLF
jgi:hypothetical protein